jgi:ABC-2 type transport system ATP-binding protein
MPDITLDHISKTYNKNTLLALDDISFEVNKGELFGLIGPDGAGKTSLFRILTTLLLPDKGFATVSGFDVVKNYKSIRGIIGYMPGKFSLYQDLTVEENLKFFATVFKTTVEKNYDLIRDIYVQIEPFKKRRAGQLSGGMKQKLALCCALIHKPEVLFLDEPTTGVDAVSRREFWEMLKSLQKENITILVSTAYMDEATLCDRIGLIQSGKMLTVDTPENVLEAYPENLFAIKSKNVHKLLTDLRKFENTLQCYASGEYLHLSFKTENENSQNEVVVFLKEKGHDEIEMKMCKPSIEDCFIRLLAS